ncbi:arylesterase [Phaeovulum sp.]|uniref:arylesterase n=1 Tax=Phaeovulum sp. TaxID=2934796 RepID=UPI0035677FE9
MRWLRNLVAVTFLLATPVFAAPLQIVALGDSLTQGYGLAPEDGLVPQLQAWLVAAGADVVVQNAGVSGDTTAGGRARLEWSLAGGADALIVALGGNDLLRGLPPEVSRANLDAILSEADARDLPVLLVGLPAPSNYGAEYQTAFDAIFPDLAAAHGALLLENLLAPIMALSAQERSARELMQSDGIHPAPEGVQMVVAQLGPKVLDLLAQVPPR